MMFAIAWEYLTGRAVATDPTDRQKAEWPPHPDRVFQALVAAWGETKADTEGKAALEWLEGQGPPEVSCPGEEAVSRREPEKVFVPVNDVVCPIRNEGGFNSALANARARAKRNGKEPEAEAAKKASELVQQGLDLLPARSARADRFFPCVYVGEAVCALRWPLALIPTEHRSVLERLCSQVTYVGHSRSLVRMWIAEKPPPSTLVPATERLRPSISLRVPVPGRLSALVKAYAEGGSGWGRPPWAPWHGYVPARTTTKVAQGVFDERLIILHHSGGDRIQLPQVAAFTAAFRKLLIAACDEPAVPARVRSLISGHNADGTALDQPHVAFLALAHVGSLHADGHIMGFVMALPRGIQPESEHELCKVLGRCLEASGRDSLRLLAGRAGACELRIEDRVKPPRTLQEATWVAESRSWASVTPVVLDKLAPRRHVNDDSWAANQIVHSCVRQGLPKPVGVAILPVSRFTGAPPARAFPALMRKSDNVKRWHVHAQLYFEEPVRGPLVLGAGRYRGMGLCRPLDEGRT